MRYSVDTMEHQLRKAVDKQENFVEEIVLGLDLEKISQEDLFYIASIFEEKVREYLEKSTISPLINSFNIVATAEVRDALSLKLEIEVFHRSDVSRELVTRLIDDIIDRSYRDTEKIILEKIRK